MTETDATKRPLNIPENFVPYLEKHRVYKVFKDMIRDLVLNLPKDHLKHMKVYLNRYMQGGQNANGILILVSPELKDVDIKEAVSLMREDISYVILTRRYIMDTYKKHDEYIPGCVSTALLSKVTKMLMLKEPVPHTGWLMFDHPCTLAEARGLQQIGVLPTITLLMIPPPPIAPSAPIHLTSARNFFQQDFEALKFAYRSTITEVQVLPNEKPEAISTRLFNAIRACLCGASGSNQGHLVLGAPSVYRVLLLGPRGSGRRTHAIMLAKRFGLVYLSFEELCKQAIQGKDEVGRKLRDYGQSFQLRAEIVARRIMQKVLRYSFNAKPLNVIFLNADWITCKNRLMARGVNWCTGKQETIGSNPRIVRQPRDQESLIERDLEYYFSEALLELRAAAGITAIEIDAQEPEEKVQTKIQAAVIAAPAFDTEYCAHNLASFTD